MTKKVNFLKFIDSVRPEEDFDDDKRPEPPNYDDESYWAALPGRDGMHFLSPDKKPSPEIKKFDVFYIHPTGYFLKHWNEPLEHDSASYERTGSHLASQASAFSETCNIYAPYYRQATYFSFYDLKSNGTKAQDLAYSDISKAFEIFLNKHNHGRPFFIAGHSQGALHGQRLIHEYISMKSPRENFIAAYLIGYILPIKHFSNLYPDLFISQSPDDQKSIISWSTGVQGFKRSKAYSMFWLPGGWTTELMEQPNVCQNPMCWTVNHDWQEDKNNIAIRLKSDKLFLNDYYATKHKQSKIKVESIIDLNFEARFSKNYMIETRGPLIDKIKSFAPNGDLHNFDISLFWGAIRNNVKVRANAF
tara:strand:- start:106 stop:1188 length:1083 start_codon:yes stop_codon:yes gene_type:complete